VPPHAFTSSSDIASAIASANDRGCWPGFVSRFAHPPHTSSIGASGYFANGPTI
jgi:hypothetical protein